MKKVYIAGAITNNPNYREQFKAAEERLKAEGYAVINPCKNEGFTYREYINMGICELMHCDAIYLLKGYETSIGALLEYAYARAVGLIIMTEPGAITEEECRTMLETNLAAVGTVQEMGDLISRSALIEAIIQHGKDVKCGEPILNELYQGAHKHIIQLVEIQPTAFDVKKVITELEENKRACEDDYIGLDCEDDFGAMNAYRHATDIVRRGGVE